MGRKRKLQGVRDVFVFNQEGNSSSCLICDKKINGNHLGNLTHHLKKHHPDVLNNLDVTASPREPPEKKMKITLEYNPKEVLDAWCNLVIHEGRPFVLLDSKNLRLLIKPIFEALKMDMISSHNISEKIRERMEALVNDISAICKNRMLSLKIDSATRHRRRVMCVNLQFTHNSELIVLTLAMKELNGPHTGVNVRDYVLSVLQRYKIQLDQIYSCTQDNGKNLILAAKLMQFNGYDDNDENNGEDGDCDENSSADDQFESESEDELEYDQETLTNYALLELHGVEVIRCAAHVLALIVEDTLKTLNVNTKIARIRNLIKFLLTPTCVDKIKSQTPKLNLPHLDNKTRWNTKYDMILSVMPLKNFCNTNIPTKEKISESEWAFCQTFLELFKPVKIATKKLQSEQLTLGDFFKVWLKLTLDLKELSENNKNPTLAAALYKNLISREKLLFENNKCLLAALYLDPRFRNILTKLRPDQFNIREAQEHLLSLYKQIKKVEHILRPAEEVNENVPSGDAESQVTESQNIPLRLRLRSTSTNNDLPIPSTSNALPANFNRTSSTPQPSTGDNSLDEFINDLFEDNSEPCRQVGDDDIVAAFGVICSYQDRKPLDTNVLEYWHAKRFSNPILYKLAVVVHAVPATQVSVERCFSVLKFILNDYRSSMRPDTLESLMLLRLNAGWKRKF